MVERYMDNGRRMSRDELELVVQKNKVKEIHEWFEKHFYDPDHLSYSKRCPYVILQGPTGCGKTSTLKWIARDLKLSIKEFSETTDTTSINIELKNLPRDETNFPLSIAKRNALKFERYVVDSVRYNTLYPVNNAMIETDDDADSEFDSDDDEFFLPPEPPTPMAALGQTTSNPITSSAFLPKTYPKAQSEPLPKPRRPAPPTDGVIIHVETPLSFGKFQKILTQCLHNLMRILAEISRRQPRRVAIVFETLEGDGEIISLPTKVKQLMGIKVFKFNQITQANMRNLINTVMTGYSHIIMEKETLNQLVNDCDGDARACLNTLQLICTHLDKKHAGDFNRNELQTSWKKLKTHHPELRAKKLTFTPGLARDISRNSTLFHTLGKIFYQKREYPLADANGRAGNGWKAKAQLNQPSSMIGTSKCRSIDRPYPLQNTTDYLVSRVDMEAKNLTSWLHQHYARFCRSDNISKAADFLDHLSTVDTVSLDSTQSNQFFESKPLIDQLQKYIAIEATVFSLYTDVSGIQQNPRSVKKAVNKDGLTVTIRSSVETNQVKDGSDLYGFTRPTSSIIPKLSKGYRSLIDLGSSRMMLISERPIEQSKFLLEYSPYMSALLANYKKVPNSRSIASPEGSRYHVATSRDWSNLKPFAVDRDLCEIIDELQLKSTDSTFSDEQKHEELYERLVEMIDRCEIERFGRDDEDSDMMSQ